MATAAVSPLRTACRAMHAVPCSGEPRKPARVNAPVILLSVPLLRCKRVRTGFHPAARHAIQSPGGTWWRRWNVLECLEHVRLNVVGVIGQGTLNRRASNGRLWRRRSGAATFRDGTIAPLRVTRGRSILVVGLCGPGDVPGADVRRGSHAADHEIFAHATRVREGPGATGAVMPGRGEGRQGEACVHRVAAAWGKRGHQRDWGSRGNLQGSDGSFHRSVHSCGSHGALERGEAAGQGGLRGGGLGVEGHVAVVAIVRCGRAVHGVEAGRRGRGSLRQVHRGVRVAAAGYSGRMRVCAGGGVCRQGARAGGRGSVV